MIVWAVRVLAVVVVALAIALGVQTWRLNRAAERDLQARAKLQAEQLVAAGWQRAAEASKAELARIVPEHKSEIDALTKAGATLAAASHWTGHGDAVPVPCIVTMGPPAGTDPPALHSPPRENESEAPLISTGLIPGGNSVAVTPHVKIDDAVSLDDAGGLYVVRKVHARLSVGETWTSEWQPVTADAESTFAVDPDIAEAWRAWKNPTRKIRAGFFVGVGAAVALDGRVTPGLVGGWGVTF